MNSKTFLDAPESYVREPRGELARTPVHAYKHDKHFINVHKLNNASKINHERFNDVIGDLPEDVKQYVKAGRNYEELLDRCEGNGTSISEIRTAVGKVNYSNAYKIGGLLNDVLQGLAGVKRGSKSSSTLSHCGDDYCDPVTRTFPEPSKINGRMENRCPKCNDQLINEIERRKPKEPFEWDNFGELPDDV
jgi:hypothetical protein